MAQMTPGYSFGVHEGVTAAKLHSLVDSAYLVNVANADLVAAIREIWKTAPGSPTNGDVRVGSTGLLEFFYSGAWQTQPGQPVQLTLTNKSGFDLVTGDVVVPDPANANSFKLASVNRPPNPLGALAADIANNASGLVTVRGRALVRIATSGLVWAPGEIISAPNGASATFDIQRAGFMTSAHRSDMMGMVLVQGTGTPTALVQAYLWK